MKISNFAKIAAAAQQAQTFASRYSRKQKPLIFSRKIRGSSLQNWWSRGDLNPFQRLAVVCKARLYWPFRPTSAAFFRYLLQ